MARTVAADDKQENLLMETLGIKKGATGKITLMNVEEQNGVRLARCQTTTRCAAHNLKADGCLVWGLSFA
jgi:hypothetical protein